MNVRNGKIKANPVIWLAGLAVFFLCYVSIKEGYSRTEGKLWDVLKQDLAISAAEAIHKQHLPIISYLDSREQNTSWFAKKAVENIMPIYDYTLKRTEEKKSEEYLAQEKDVKKSLEKQQDMENLEKLLLAENLEAQRQKEQALKKQQEMEEAKAKEQAKKQFVPHQLQTQVDLAALSNYEKLVNDFYTIDANTMAGNELLEVNKLMERDMSISKEGEAPQILIYHTHSQETFADSVPGDKSTSIIGVGECLSEILTSRYGYKVLHHTGEYDVETRDDAYSVSLPAIEQVLLENPSIQVVIDLHRDQMPEETKLVMDLDGRPTARFMFFNGLSRTKKTGNISYLQNDNLADNLAFSFQMQLKAMQYYPGLTRKIYLKGYRYNMHLCPKTLLIELGAQNNTVEEVMNACEPIAHILDMVLSGQ